MDKIDIYEERLSGMDRETLEAEYILRHNLTAHEIDGLFKKTNNELIADLIDLLAAGELKGV